MKKVIYSASFLEFLKHSECKIANILFRLHSKQYKSAILTTKEINYLTFRKDGTISYLPDGKELKYNDNGDWSLEGRQNGKPAKVIRKLFVDRFQRLFKDADFECFTNSYKANFNDDGYTFELLSNTHIPDVYEMDRADGEGSLNSSCMNGDSEYLDIYKYCPLLQILVLKNKAGLLCGRSLVWKISDEITLMDRIYTTQDFMFDKFLSFAKENKFWTKRDYRSYDNKTYFINLSGEVVCKEFTVYTNTDFDQYPYIDTFSYGNDGSLNNYGSGEYTYNCTDGCREGGEDDHSGEVYDDINCEYIDEDDAVYIESGERQYRDRYCHVNNCVRVDDEWYYEEDDNIVEVNGDYYKKDSDDICCIDGDYYKMDDCIYCERDSTYYLQDDCVYCENDEEDVLRSEAVKVNDTWYHKESDKIVEIDGTWYEVDSDEIEIDAAGNYTVIETIED